MNEEKKIWENLRHDLIYGTKNFLNQIKSTYLSKEVNVELPQLAGIIQDKDPTDLLRKAAKILNCDIDKFTKSPRVSKKHIQDRDLLLYFMLETGLYTNRQIGDLFGLSYPAVSRRANISKCKVKRKKQDQDGLIPSILEPVESPSALSSEPKGLKVERPDGSSKACPGATHIPIYV